MAGNFSDEFDGRKVIDLAAARASRNRAGKRSSGNTVQKSRYGNTLLIRAAAHVAGEEVIRHIGIDENLQLGQLGDIMATAFNLGEESVPSGFTVESDSQRWLDPHHLVAEYFSDEGDGLYYHWGLWTFSVVLGDKWPRDEGTPRALCVGGLGDFGGVAFDLSRINELLTDDGVAQEVLSKTRPEVAGVIQRSGVFDFIPLLHAMDLGRSVRLDADVSHTLQGLPREISRQGVDAFWSTVLGLACLASDELTDQVIEETMEALGWTTAEGSSYSAAEITDMCAASLAELQRVGGYQEPALAPIDRLELYRELLRASGD
ncbi:hypothetical protein [Corynebacterium lubricantis]|uniref:hypothetical protein n=1 Tax=Corynebacterium lubricantis TaxID=541095 RepID=UPI00037FBE5D|nr:hypothetical protein [Corynebacterium lubricantis]